MNSVPELSASVNAERAGLRRHERLLGDDNILVALDVAESDLDSDGDDDDDVRDPDNEPGRDTNKVADMTEEIIDRTTLEVPREDDSLENEHPREEFTPRGTSRVLWRLGSASDATRVPEYLGPVHIFADDLRQPIEYFRRFFTNDLLDIFVAQSNLYAVQNNPNKPLNIDQKELEQWFGLCIYFSISKLPNTHMHWSNHLGALRDITADVMSRNRFENIKYKLHLVDNTTIDGNKNDKLFKVRPIITHLRKMFQQIPMIQSLCVDEQIVPFKGNSGIKQYLPNKPHKWGYKFFLFSHSKGITYDFIPYTGKIEPVNDPSIPDLKYSSNTVLHLAQAIPSHQNHLLYFDNWFTSLPLLSHLANRGIWCCGTVRKPRLPGIVGGKVSDNELINKGRGSYEERKTVGDKHTATYVKWYDSRIVNTVSTFTNAKPLSVVQRFDQKKKCKMEVECPTIIKLYNSEMGGVDLADFLIALNRINIRSKKYYHHLIFHMIDTVIVNCWLLYRRDAENLKLPKSEILALAQFKLRLAFALMKDGKNVGNFKRGRPTLDETLTEKSARKGEHVKHFQKSALGLIILLIYRTL